jgi:hypothetical protein
MTNFNSKLFWRACHQLQHSSCSTHIATGVPGEVCHPAISHTPLPPASFRRPPGWERGQATCYFADSTWWRNCSENHYECLAHTNSLLLHLLVLQLVQKPCRLLGKLQILVKSGGTHLLSPHEPERVSHWSSSTSAAISTMKVFAQRCHLSAATTADFPSFAFLIIAHSCILIKAFLTFLIISCIFFRLSWLWRALSQNRYDGE